MSVIFFRWITSMISLDLLEAPIIVFVIVCYTLYEHFNIPFETIRSLRI
jgi:hypothetical protein